MDLTPETVGATLLAVRSEKKLSRKALLEQLGGRPWSTGRLGDLEKGKHPWSYFRPAERATLLTWLELQGFGVAALGGGDVDRSVPGTVPGTVVAAERLGVDDHLVYGDDGTGALELLGGDDEPRLLELVEVVSAPGASASEAPGASVEVGRVDEEIAAAVDAVNTRLAGRPAPFPWPTPYPLDAAPPSDLERVLRWCERVRQWLDDVDSGRAAYQPADGATPVAPTAPSLEVSGPTPGGAVTLAVVPTPVESRVSPAPGDHEVVGAAALTRDGLRRLTNSELQTFKHCRRRWWLSWYRGLRLRAEPPGGLKGIGTWVHDALARWYVPEGQTPEDPRLALGEIVQAEELALLQSTAHLEDAVVATKVADLQKDADLARAMVEGYVEWLAESGADVGLTVVAPEQVLRAVLECSARLTVQLQGRLDVRLRRDADLVHLFMDHKCQPVDEPVLTPEGWRPIGDLVVGDEVVGHDGEAKKVLGVFDRGLDQVYRLEFNDGTWTRATGDHVWTGRTHLHGRTRTRETADLRPGWRPTRFTPSSDDDGVDVPVSPYVLGAWLANGDRHGRGLCDGEEQPVAVVAQVLGTRVHEAPPRQPGYGPLWSTQFPRSVQSALDDLGLLGRYSRERFIPPRYLYRAAWHQRLWLLRALMDGDGTFRRGTAFYTTTSPQLAEDVATLTRSLGGWAKVWSDGRPCRYVVDGVTTETETVGYNVYVRSEFNPFGWSKHATTWRDHRTAHVGHRGTTSTDKILKRVVPAGEATVRCIQIDSDEHLYVTRGWTLTHNTVGNFTEPARRLPMDEQMKTYLLLEQAQAEGAGYVDGALYNLLRRVKRTAQAKPPFFERLEVRHNPTTVATFRERLKGQALTVDLVERSLDEGVDHHLIAYPSPSNRCAWGCEFFALCPMFDDGSRAEDFITEHYVVVNPLDRYDHEETES